MRLRLLLLTLFLSLGANAQLRESFSGTHLTSDNPWEGDVDEFIINTQKQLEFVSPQGEAGSASVSVPVGFAADMSWEIRLKLDFKTTHANNFRMYVYSSGGLSAYLQAGNNNGQISFYTQEDGASAKLRIGGRNLLAEEPYPFVSIRLTLEEGDTWTLYTRAEGETAYQEEGRCRLAVDTPPDGNRLTLMCRYIKGRVSAYYFDELKVELSATEPPGESSVELMDVEYVKPDKLQFTFDREVDISRASCTVSDLGDATGISYGANRKTVVVRLPGTLEEEREYIVDWVSLYDMDGLPVPDFSVEIYLEKEEEPDEPVDPSEPEDPLEPEDPEDPLEPQEPAAPSDVEPGEIVFNELLPNPYAGGCEYIELFNRSGRRLSLAGLSVAKRKEDGSLSTRYPLPSATLEADGYMLLTKELKGVSDYYLIRRPEALFARKLPVLANTGSVLVLFRETDGDVVDEVAYSSKWHSSAVRNQKGVSLERIDPDAPTQDAANWTSAASIDGYGTPGYQNSQYKNTGSTNPTGVQPPVLSDDGMYRIRYGLDEPGYSCRAYIYNVAGQRVATVANRELLGLSGEMTWNGKAGDGGRLRTGIYILFVELYHPGGRTKQYKKVFPVR